MRKLRRERKITFVNAIVIVTERIGNDKNGNSIYEVTLFENDNSEVYRLQTYSHEEAVNIVLNDR